MEQEMKYIYTIYKNASFSKAADKLFITQPALSIAVSKVEARIGMPLFDRTSKPLKLTPAGEYYIQKYYEIRNLENELEQQLNDLSSLQTGTLRIGGSHYFNSYVLPPVLVSFSKKYPNISLKLTEAGSDSLLERLYNQDIDLTFNCSEKPKDSFRRTPCFIDTLLLSVPKTWDIVKRLEDFAFSADDILKKKHQRFDVPTVSLSEFADIPFILLTPGNNLHDRCYAMFEAAGFNPVVKMQVSQLVTAWHLSAAGMGATFITDFLISSQNQDVAVFKVRSPYVTRVFDLTMSDRHYVSKAMAAFSEIMLDHYDIHVPDRRHTCKPV